MGEAAPNGERGPGEVRDHIIRLARTWLYNILDPAEDFADALLADLGLEQVGWLQDADTLDPAPVKMQHGEAFYAGDVGVCVPIYRLRGVVPLSGGKQSHDG